MRTHTRSLTLPPLCPSASPQGTLASASWDRTVRLWNVYGGSTKATEELAHKTDVLALAIRPDGEQLATATLDGHISLWDVESGRQVGSIDGRRDIRGGRSETDKITARKNAKSRYFTSLCYTADGSCILAGGNSRFVCIYEVSARLLVKRFQVSHNRSLAGVVDELNSRNMTEAGPAALIDARSDEEDEQERYVSGRGRWSVVSDLPRTRLLFPSLHLPVLLPPCPAVTVRVGAI